jgi:uncharacterized protein
MDGSAIYAGVLRHRRLQPVEHAFAYPVLFCLLDLAELPEAFDRHPLWSARRPAPVSWRRADHLYDPALRLEDEARQLVREAIGRAPGGPVRLLTAPRMLGFGYNPVSFYFLYERSGAKVDAVMAEVTSTPWGERVHYVLEGGAGSRIAGRVAKRMHVSPFMPMRQSYEWSTTAPGETLAIGIANHEDGERVFQAKLELRRRPLTRREMTRAMSRYPPQALATLARIYGNAARLRSRGLRPILRVAARAG